jgi:hypothetical protein
MKKEFVTYNIALRLEALGFNEPCLAFYQTEYVEVTPQLVDDDYEYKMTGFRTCKNSEIPNHYVAAPTLRQVFEWFRAHNLYSTINIDQTMEPKFCYSIIKYNQYEDGQFDWQTIVFNSDLERSYELAEVACIEKLCDTLESNI